MHRIGETVAGGSCIGYVERSAATGGPIHVQSRRRRRCETILVTTSEPQIRAASRLCPFSDEYPNSNELSVPDTASAKSADHRLGVHSGPFAGRVSERCLVGSRSGGLAYWLVERLITERRAEAVIHVGTSASDDSELFRHNVSNRRDAGGRRRSQYYPTTMANALRRVEDVPQRHIVVGGPCFIHAARALCRENPVFNERLVFFVGLVCGHYKTHAFSDSLAWQLSVHPRDLAAVDSASGTATALPTTTTFAAQSVSTGDTGSAPVRNLAGGNWGHNAFQPEACNSCDDVVGEAADVSFGDAWLPAFTSHPYGTNVVVSRNRVIDDIFDGGAAARAITVFDASPDRVSTSQAGGFRHRRDGLAVRLADDIAAGLSVPTKRVSPAQAVDVPPKRANLIRHRRRMAARSHDSFLAALEKDDLRIYLREFRREAARYRRLDVPLPRRILQSIKRVGRRLLNRLNG